MFSRWLNNNVNPALADTEQAWVQAERSQLAETLLKACAQLVESAAPDIVIRRVCESVTAATPSIVLAWVWLGDADTDVIEPQVVVGPASEYGRTLRIERNFLTQLGPAYRVLSGEPPSSFAISRHAVWGPWREAARRFGVRSVVVVPLSGEEPHRGLFALYSSIPNYFDRVGVTLFEALGQLFHAVLRQSRKRVELETEAARDELTGLPNRRQALRTLEALWRQPAAGEHRGVMMMIDLDHFKSINDRFGHTVGDAALQHVAGVLSENLRHGDLVTRWGGDEFLVWLPGVTADGADGAAEQLRQRVLGRLFDALDGTGLELHVSIGATAVNAFDAFATALNRADRALFQAKQSGRNAVMVAPVNG